LYVDPKVSGIFADYAKRFYFSTLENSKKYAIYEVAHSVPFHTFQLMSRVRVRVILEIMVELKI